MNNLILDNLSEIKKDFNNDCNTTRLYYKVCKAFDGFVNERVVIEWSYKIIAKSDYVLKSKNVGSEFKIINTNTKLEIIEKGFMEMKLKDEKVYIKVLK